MKVNVTEALLVSVKSDTGLAAYAGNGWNETQLFSFLAEGGQVPRPEFLAGGSVPKVVEKGIGISYPVEKPIDEKGRIYRRRKDTPRDRN